MSRKMINFDLDTKALQMHYPKSDWHNAYSDIRSFLEKEGFEHRQGSGYISSCSMPYYKVQASLYKMKQQMPWLTHCVNKIDVSNIGKTYDETGIFVSNSEHQLIELQSDEIYLSEEKSIFKSR